MSGACKHILCHILLTAWHTHNALAASVLCLVGINRLTLDISFFCKSKNTILDRNQVLVLNVSRECGNFRSSLIAVFVGNFTNFRLNYLKHSVLVRENVVIILNLFLQIVQLVHNLFDFESGKLSQTVSHDSGSLRVIKAELVHNGLLCLALSATARTNGCDNIVNNVECLCKSFEDMLSLLRLAKIISCTAGDNLLLELYILVQNFFKR